MFVIPSFDIGLTLHLAMVEYSLDLKIPEYVWSHPVLEELSKAAIDIMTWPNVSVSFPEDASSADSNNKSYRTYAHSTYVSIYLHQSDVTLITITNRKNNPTVIYRIWSCVSCLSMMSTSSPLSTL